MSTDVLVAESSPRKPLIYKLPPEQLANAARRGIKRRNVESFREAQKRKALARSAAKRLERSIRRNDDGVDGSVVGLCQKLKRIGETRVVGKNYGEPRPGRRP